MTEKEKFEIIKEIAECNKDSCKDCKIICTYYSAITLFCEKVLPEGSVVLTKEEYEDLQENIINLKFDKLDLKNEIREKDNKIALIEKETLEKIKLKPIECGEEIGYYYLDIRVTGKELIQRVYFNSDFIDGKVRKETAKEILDEIMSVGTEDEKWLKNEPFIRYVKKMLNKIEELAKQYGVEE